MTKLVQTLLESVAVLAVGLTIVGALMFAFANNAAAANGGPKSVGSSLEVIISDNGRAVVRGAEVTAVSDSTISARTSWGAAALTWTVRTDGDTDYVHKNGSSASRGDMNVGDYISFSGTIDGDAGTFTVDADAVKNWSDEATFAVITGTVTDVNGDSFTLRTKKDAEVEVTTDGNTNFTGGSIADIDVGDTVVASGSYDASGSLDATKVSLNLRGMVDPIVKEKWNDWAKNFPVFNWFKKDR